MNFLDENYLLNCYIKKYDDDNFEFVILKFNTSNRKLNYNDSDLDNSSFDSSLNELNEKEKFIVNEDYKEYLSFKSSVSRSRRCIFEYSACNQFDYFITLTLNQKKDYVDVYCIDDFIKKFGKFIGNYNRRNKNLGYDKQVEYLLIPEKHRSGAWHMHGLIKNIPERDLFLNKNNYLDWLPYKKRFGFVSLSKVKNNLAVSKYITKYITKSFSDYRKRKNKKLYYVTRGLKKAEKVFEGSCNTKNLSSLIDDSFFENDYVFKKEIKKEELTKILQSNLLVQFK